MKPKDYISKKAAEEALKAYQGSQLNSTQETSPYFVGKINSDRTKITDPTGRQYNLIFTGNPKTYELAQRLNNDTAVVNATPGKTINVDGGKSLYILGRAGYFEGIIWVLHKVGTSTFNYLDTELSTFQLREGGHFSPTGKSIVIWDTNYTRIDPGIYDTLPAQFMFRIFKNWKFNTKDSDGDIIINGIKLHPVLAEIEEGVTTIPDILQVPPIPPIPSITPTPTNEYEGPTGYFNPGSSTSTFRGFRVKGFPNANERLILTENEEGEIGGNYYFYVDSVYSEASAGAVSGYAFTADPPVYPITTTCHGSTTPVEYPPNAVKDGSPGVTNITYRSSFYKVLDIFSSPNGQEIFFQQQETAEALGLGTFQFFIDRDLPLACLVEQGEVPIITGSTIQSGASLDGVDITNNTFASGQRVQFEVAPDGYLSLCIGDEDAFSHNFTIRNFIDSSMVYKEVFPNSGSSSFRYTPPSWFLSKNFQLSGNSSPYNINGGAYRRKGNSAITFLNKLNDNTISVNSYKVKNASEKSGLIILEEDDFSSGALKFRTEFIIEDGYNVFPNASPGMQPISSYSFNLRTHVNPNEGLSISIVNGLEGDNFTLGSSYRGDYLLR